MTLQRVFGGQADLTGQTLGTLFVQGVKAIRPVLVYYCFCNACSTVATYTHAELRAGKKCRQPQCGLEIERQEEHRQAVRRRNDAIRSWIGE